MDKAKQGRKNRRVGAEFERKVRQVLSEAGWTVSRWQCDINIPMGTIQPAKSNRFLMRTTGFPDFIAIKNNVNILGKENVASRVLLVECKSNGRLSREEKAKVAVYRAHKFTTMLAKKEEGKVVIDDIR